MVEAAKRTVLDEEQIERYHRDGFLVVRGLFSSDETAELRQVFMEQYADGPVPGLSDSNHELDSSDPLARYPRAMHPHRHPELPVGPISERYMLDERLGSRIRDLFGEEPIAAQSMFYFKPPGARGQDLHQDNFYLRVKPGTCMAAWVAIDDADRDNGGMVVAPGSGTLGIACPERADSTRFFTRDHVDIPDGLQEQPVDLQEGDVLFFNGSVIHGSYSNTSPDRFRRAFICHYVPRGSAEVAHWYRPLFAFDGQEVFVRDATGGGACGEVQPIKGPH